MPQGFDLCTLRQAISVDGLLSTVGPRERGEQARFQHLMTATRSRAKTNCQRAFSASASIPISSTTSASAVPAARSVRVRWARDRRSCVGALREEQTDELAQQIREGLPPGTLAIGDPHAGCRSHRLGTAELLADESRQVPQKLLDQRFLGPPLDQKPAALREILQVGRQQRPRCPEHLTGNPHLPVTADHVPAAAERQHPRRDPVHRHEAIPRVRAIGQQPPPMFALQILTDLRCLRCRSSPISNSTGQPCAPSQSQSEGFAEGSLMRLAGICSRLKGSYLFSTERRQARRKPGC